MEIELIERCKKEDRRAQQEFYKICYTRFIGTAFRYAKDKEEAVHYFNLGFVRILMNLKQFDVNNPFDYWAKRVLINTILNELKKDARWNSQLEYHDGSSAHTDHWEDEAETAVQEKIELILSTAEQLPPMTKNVFNLYAIDGYKHHEIAAMLGISENTSMWHYSDAKKKIRKLLAINLVTNEA